MALRWNHDFMYIYIYIWPYNHRFHHGELDPGAPFLQLSGTITLQAGGFAMLRLCALDGLEISIFHVDFIIFRMDRFAIQWLIMFHICQTTVYHMYILPSSMWVTGSITWHIGNRPEIKG